jgi:glycosyltransferase involved in cell wall biosynthesis
MSKSPTVSVPKVSVLMPVYNNAQYLAAAVESILAQTFAEFEFIIIDDGSTDASGKILEQYAAQDDRIQLIRRANLGIAKTRNQLLEQASAELVAIMDGDDIALPDRFARQVDFLQAHPKVVCVGSAIDWIDEGDRYLGHCDMPESDAEIQSLLVGGISMLHHPCTMARRSALLQVGGYDETMIASIDLDLWLRLGEVGKLANLPETLLHYRLHSKSITHKRQQRQADDAYAACQRAWQRRGIAGTFVRKPADHLHQHDFLVNCGWLGFKTGQRRLAQRCGLRAIAAQPFSKAAWNLLACAILQPLPAQSLPDLSP